jgi:hypothetical protein
MKLRTYDAETGERVAVVDCGNQDEAKQTKRLLLAYRAESDDITTDERLSISRLS